MNARNTAGRLLAGLAVVALLAGCAGGASPTPVTFGPVTVVTGTDSCPGLNPDWTIDPDSTAHVRDLAVECVDKTDDPRVSGTATGNWSMDFWGNPNQGMGAGVQWGTIRLVNDRGAWDGKLSGVGALPEPGDTIVIWYTGTGGYAGLTYFQLITGHPSWKIQGEIYPGDPPPPYAEEATGTGRPEAGGPVADKAVTRVTGTHACPSATPDWTTDPDGTMHFRDYALECTDTTDDPRVSGTHTGSANIDVWGTLDHGAGVQWASVRLENAGGAWEGRAMGVASLPGRGDTIVIWYKGTGGYEGLSYFELITGSDPWNVQGQIFPGDPPMP